MDGRMFRLESRGWGCSVELLYLQNLRQLAEMRKQELDLGKRVLLCGALPIRIRDLVGHDSAPEPVDIVVDVVDRTAAGRMEMRARVG